MFLIALYLSYGKSLTMSAFEMWIPLITQNHSSNEEEWFRCTLEM